MVTFVSLFQCWVLLRSYFILFDSISIPDPMLDLFIVFISLWLVPSFQRHWLNRRFAYSFDLIWYDLVWLFFGFCFCPTMWWFLLFEDFQWTDFNEYVRAMRLLIVDVKLYTCWINWDITRELWYFIDYGNNEKP